MTGTPSDDTFLLFLVIHIGGVVWVKVEESDHLGSIPGQKDGRMRPSWGTTDIDGGNQVG